MGLSQCGVGDSCTGELHHFDDLCYYSQDGRELCKRKCDWCVRLHDLLHVHRACLYDLLPGQYRLGFGFGVTVDIGQYCLGRLEGQQ